MNACHFDPQLLMAWMDGQAGLRAQEARTHFDGCEQCQAQVEEWKQAGAHLQKHIDEELGAVDPLRGLQKIRQRISSADNARLTIRLQTWFDDLWLFQRQALKGVAIAFALGILSAPAVLWWIKSASPGSARAEIASVVLESMEFEATAQPVVLHDQQNTVTLIWMEPSKNLYDQESH